MLSYVYECLPAYTTCMPGSRAQKKALACLEVQVVVSHHVGDGYGPQVLYKGSKCSQLLNLLSRLDKEFF